MPRAFVWLTYLPAAALLFGLPHSLWAALLFPLWVLGLSLYLLVRRIDAPIAPA
jgi:type IV secretory pathway TrbD component